MHSGDSLQYCGLYTNYIQIQMVVHIKLKQLLTAKPHHLLRIINICSFYITFIILYEVIKIVYKNQNQVL